MFNIMLDLFIENKVRISSESTGLELISRFNLTNNLLAKARNSGLASCLRITPIFLPEGFHSELLYLWD